LLISIILIFSNLSTDLYVGYIQSIYQLILNILEEFASSVILVFFSGQIEAIGITNETLYQ